MFQAFTTGVTRCHKESVERQTRFLIIRMMSTMQSTRNTELTQKKHALTDVMMIIPVMASSTIKMMQELTTTVIFGKDMDILEMDQDLQSAT